MYKSTPQRVHSTKLFPTMTSWIPYPLLSLLPTEALGPFECSRDRAQGVDWSIKLLGDWRINPS